MTPANTALWLTSRRGGFRVGPAPYPTAGPGEVVVEARALALNPVDAVPAVARRVVYPWLHHPAVLGTDVAGVVVAAGPTGRSGPGRLEVGDRVVGFATGQEKFRNDPAYGAFQRFVVLAADLTARPGRRWSTGAPPSSSGAPQPASGATRCSSPAPPATGWWQPPARRASRASVGSGPPRSLTTATPLRSTRSWAPWTVIGWRGRWRSAGVRVSAIWGGTPAVSPVGPALFRDFLPAALADGRLHPAPAAEVVRHELGAIPDALLRLRPGVRGRKLVVVLGEAG